ncbi:MAG: hypothetical protein ACOYNG_08525 [Terrimicrobiaceae bacterium]
MKINKFLAAATAALGLATMAQAQTEIFIAGAPALRTELTTAIENLLLGQTSVDRTFNGSAIITANVVRWRNASIGGQGNVTIHLVYNGSAGGWKTNSASQQVRYFTDNTTASSGATDVLSNTTAPAKLAVPDFHISNEFQDSTPWIGTNQISFPENGATTYQSLVEEIVGILPLRLVASKGAPNGLNITPQLAQQLYADGELRLSQLTGNQSDYGKKVYPLSRGIDSGIRTLWAAGNGLGTTTPIKTWSANVTNTTNKPVVGITVVSPGVGYTSAPTVTVAAPAGNGTTATATATVANGRITGFTVTNGGSGYSSAPSVSLSGGNGSLASARAVIEGGTVTSHNLWAAAGRTLGANGTDNRVLGINTPVGNGGYPTFGPLLTALTSTLSLPGGNAGDIYFTVLGDSDADSAIRGGAKEVSWNGNTLGTLGTYGNDGGVENTPTSVGSATPSLANGSYDLWGYVRLPYRSNALPTGTPKRAIFDAVANQLRNFDAPVKLGDVNVQRYSDGGSIVQGQFVP